MITRDLVKVMPALIRDMLINPACSTGGDQISGTANNGVVIDRLGADLLGRGLFCTVGAWVYATLGSTELNQKVTLAAKLQHGDSSGGGDMADYSTGQQGADAVFMTSIETTTFASWNTGLPGSAFPCPANPSSYNLKAAKQFVRAVLTVTIADQTTVSASGDPAASAVYRYVQGVVAFHGSVDLPWDPNTTGAGSTSTATSTA